MPFFKPYYNSDAKQVAKPNLILTCVFLLAVRSAINRLLATYHIILFSFDLLSSIAVLLKVFYLFIFIFSSRLTSKYVMKSILPIAQYTTK